jgi:hypothetical protein
MEPYQKRELLDKRLLALRGAINAGASAVRVANAVEKVRLAALAVIKAQRSLLDGRRESEALTRQLDNLQRDEERWQSLSVEAIVALAVE